MKSINTITIIFLSGILLSSCVSKKKFTEMKSKMKQDLETTEALLESCDEKKAKLSADLSECRSLLDVRKEQVEDLRKLQNKQVEQVGDLTVLSQSASENIKETLKQLERKDKYIHLLQAARSKADSINLALAVNLKSVLKDGIEDRDINIEVDKTVVFINISDSMLYRSGSYQITERASEVLGKIAKIMEDKPNMELMVEGYTDSVPIQTECIKDNWDLSVKRATSVVRVLKEDYQVDPNKLIAAGRGKYNALASNETAQGRAKNRRTRIIIMPKLNQFYELLNPNRMPE